MTVLSLTLTMLSACLGISDEDFTSRKGTIGYVSGALGVISVEEPQAALIARDVLSSGGTAADAATAIGFALTASMPSSASLAGGGICIVRDARGETPTVIDFLPRASNAPASGADRPSAVPGLPRGLFLLHSKFGELKWERVIVPAENLARFGFNVPRAFVSEYAKVADILLRDPAMARKLSNNKGGPLTEGDFLKQPDLAGTLGRIRARGVGDFYIGHDAKLLVDAVTSVGGTLTLEDLRDYRPISREPVSFPWESNTIWHFAGPPAVGGGVAAEMLAVLMDSRRFEKADAPLREHLIVEAAKRAFVQRMNNLQADGTYRQGAETRVTEAAADKISDSINDDRATPLTSLLATPVDWPETPAAVSYAVMDTRGGAVACTLTMNNLYGTGRVAPGFGAILAAAPDNLGRTFTPVGPALLTSKLNNRAYIAAAASGGVAAPTALVNVLARAAAGPQTLIESMRAPRVHYAGVPDKVFVEEGMPADVVEGLRKRGHDVVQTHTIGRVTAVYCPTGVPFEKGVSCTSANDHRGHGIALGGN